MGITTNKKPHSVISLADDGIISPLSNFTHHVLSLINPRTTFLVFFANFLGSSDNIIETRLKSKTRAKTEKVQVYK